MQFQPKLGYRRVGGDSPDCRILASEKRNTLNKKYMTTAQDKEGPRYYIIKSSIGLMIMHVEEPKIQQFLSLYSQQVIATGYTLAEVIMNSDWSEHIAREAVRLGMIPTTPKTNPQ